MEYIFIYIYINIYIYIFPIESKGLIRIPIDSMVHDPGSKILDPGARPQIQENHKIKPKPGPKVNRVSGGPLALSRLVKLSYIVIIKVLNCVSRFP